MNIFNGGKKKIIIIYFFLIVVIIKTIKNLNWLTLQSHNLDLITLSLYWTNTLKVHFRLYKKKMTTTKSKPNQTNKQKNTHTFAWFRGWQVFSVEGSIPAITSSIFCSSQISLLPFLSLFFSSFSVWRNFCSLH